MFDSLQYEQIMLTKNEWKSERTVKVESDEWKKDNREEARLNSSK